MESRKALKPVQVKIPISAIEVITDLIKEQKFSSVSDFVRQAVAEKVYENIHREEHVQLIREILQDDEMKGIFLDMIAEALRKEKEKR